MMFHCVAARPFHLLNCAIWAGVRAFCKASNCAISSRSTPELANGGASIVPASAETMGCQRAMLFAATSGVAGAGRGRLVPPPPQPAKISAPRAKRGRGETLVFTGRKYGRFGRLLGLIYPKPEAESIANERSAGLAPSSNRRTFGKARRLEAPMPHTA